MFTKLVKKKAIYQCQNKYEQHVIFVRGKKHVIFVISSTSNLILNKKKTIKNTGFVQTWSNLITGKNYSYSFETYIPCIRTSCKNTKIRLFCLDPK